MPGADEAVEARRQIRDTFHTRRDHLLASLRNIGLRCITPDGAFYTMVDIAQYGSSMDVAEALLEAGVVTIPGNAFGSESEGFLRASFCADLPVLTEGVRRIDAGLKTHAEPSSATRSSPNVTQTVSLRLVALLRSQRPTIDAN